LSGDNFLSPPDAEPGLQVVDQFPLGTVALRIFPKICLRAGGGGYAILRPAKTHTPETIAVRLFSATLAAALVAWFIASSLWIYPHSLSYFNESIGGPLNGPNHLLGSNVDWGQDLRYAINFASEQPRHAIVYYVSPSNYYTWKHIGGPSLRHLNESFSTGATEFSRTLHGLANANSFDCQYFVISVNQANYLKELESSDGTLLSGTGVVWNKAWLQQSPGYSVQLLLAEKYDD
jgi:hypothetical protein